MASGPLLGARVILRSDSASAGLPAGFGSASAIHVLTRSGAGLGARVVFRGNHLRHGMGAGFGYVDVINILAYSEPVIGARIEEFFSKSRPLAMVGWPAYLFPSFIFSSLCLSSLPSFNCPSLFHLSHILVSCSGAITWTTGHLSDSVPWACLTFLHIPGRMSVLVSPILISEKIRKICEKFLKILIFRKRIEVSGI